MRLVLFIALCLMTSGAFAQNTLMARLSLKTDIAMEYLSDAIEDHGYSIAHIQTCDSGLADFGYKSDFYRVIFFGKGSEVRNLSEKYPALIPYMPLKIAIFAEGDETVITVLNPLMVSEYFPEREVKIQFRRWNSDVESILKDMRQAALLHEPPAPDFQ